MSRLVSQAVDQSSHAQQDAMIDWGGQARRAGAGSVLRESSFNSTCPGADLSAVGTDWIRNVLSWVVQLTRPRPGMRRSSSRASAEPCDPSSSARAPSLAAPNHFDLLALLRGCVFLQQVPIVRRAARAPLEAQCGFAYRALCPTHAVPAAQALQASGLSFLQTGLKIFQGHEQHAEHLAATLKE